MMNFYYQRGNGGGVTGGVGDIPGLSRGGRVASGGIGRHRGAEVGRSF